MKKILLILIITLILFVRAGVSYAQDNTDVKFIYVNGSNSNDEIAKTAYINGFHSLHKELKKVFENDEFISKHMLKNNNYVIDENEEVLFWGYQSKKDLEDINDNLVASKKVSPIIVQHLRSFLAHCMHDAIWIQRDYNMKKVIDQMHKNVMQAYKHNQKIVLLGHSAGSFVTYEYLLHKAKAVNLNFLTGKDENKYTCLDAVIDSGIGYQLSNDKVIKNPNEKMFQEGYNNIDKYTECSCIPDKTVLGVINFGSPLSLFYSSQISRSRENSSAYQIHFLKYMQSNDMFFLTVNFADDPLGFPVGSNVSKNDVEMEFNIILDENGKGFIYNYSKIRSKTTFAFSHFAYWKRAKRFAKMVRDAYIKGYNNFYGIYNK